MESHLSIGHLTSAKLIEVNNSWEYPDYVPSPNEIMPGGLRDLIGGKRKLKKSLAKKRSSFDSGVAYAINKHFFDGKDKHFKEFLSNPNNYKVQFCESIL